MGIGTLLADDVAHQKKTLLGNKSNGLVDSGPSKSKGGRVLQRGSRVSEGGKGEGFGFTYGAQEHEKSKETAETKHRGNSISKIFCHANAGYRQLEEG